MRSARAVIATVLVAGALAGLAGGTLAAWNASTDSDGMTFSAQRISDGTRSATAWQVTDAADGSAADASDATAAADALYYTTKPISATWSTSRYVEFDLAGLAPDGLTGATAELLFDFADGAGGGAEISCFYFDVRRRSTGAVLGTYGSSASPIACESTQIVRRTTTSIADAVTDTTIANDLRVRVYVQNAGANDEMRIDRAVVRVSRYGVTWDLPWVARDDRSDGVSLATAYGPATASDGAAASPAGNWSNAFSATRYATFAFPALAPTGATVTGARLVHAYRSLTAGDTTCWYFEVISGGSVIGTHGSSASPVSCNATTGYVTDTVSLPEIDTGAEAAGVSVKIYARNSGGRRTQHDVVRLELDYGLATAGCIAPGTQTLTSVADTFTDQNAPTSNYGTDSEFRVKSQNGSRNRRGYVRFTLPSTPDGCALTAATLRLFQTATQGTRSIEVLRAAASWAETTVTWTNQPATTGTAVAVANAAGWRTWDVLAHVGAGATTGFVVKDSAEDAATAAEQRFSSREGANAPQLVLTYG